MMKKNENETNEWRLNVNRLDNAMRCAGNVVQLIDSFVWLDEGKKQRVNENRNHKTVRNRKKIEYKKNSRHLIKGNETHKVKRTE